MTDPIADMLTRIRNAQMAGHTEVVLPNSKIKFAVATIMHQRGYLAGVKVVKNAAFESLIIALHPEGKIRAIKRISKPGRRIYASATQIPRVLNGRGLVILSTSKGILSDRDARNAGVGGELLCEVS